MLHLQGRVIPQLLGIGELWTGAQFVATSMVQGCSLSSLPHISTEVKQGAMSALAQVHRAGVVHGDVTLDNFMLAEPDCLEGSCASKSPARVIIIDFARAYMQASREQQAKEAARLRRLLGV